ncbi:hypothetical protein N7481_006176 [Penicillium waksmanii]|uniref:uncharacterized protein n=1 Tax=Penicillium waksmanii TaxID=69791 RepID=UPI0025496E5E|nr:uncharacterized protein N7481_006176 [Penicillium waksmanii]KAJ5984077.1 hypothetical protein N7481_006176 [Penicillium waksmanii]
MLDADLYHNHETKKCFIDKASNLEMAQMQKQSSRARTRPILPRGPRASARNAARKAAEEERLEARKGVKQEFVEDVSGEEDPSDILQDPGQISSINTTDRDIMHGLQ